MRRESLTLILKKLKDNQLESRTSMVVLTKSGEYSILRTLRRERPRDSMKNSVSTSTGHSTWSQSFHSVELLRCMETPTCGSRDGELIPNNNNGGSMRSPRPLETTTGRTIALISKEMVEAKTSELSQVSIQDGGRCSD
jgi:hypothetical protein